MASKPTRISGISVRGFKSIRTEQHIEIKPLTILAGANSSGKSSMMQPLLLLKQTLEAPGDPGALLLDGPHVRFTLPDQVLSRKPGSDPASEFAVRIDLSDESSFELTFSREPGPGFELEAMTYKAGQEKTTINRDMTHQDILRAFPKPLKRVHTDIEEGESQKFYWTIVRNQCFLSLELVSADGKLRDRFFGFVAAPSYEIVPYIQNVIHLPGLRGNPQRTYPMMAAGPSFPGTFEPYVASVIAEWQGNGERERLGDLARALETLGLTWKVKAEPVDATAVELKVGRLPRSRRGGAYDLVSIADVGFGVSQSLPVVVALFAASPGQLVYLEQPEIHLHPLAQRKLATLFRDAVRRGVVLVVETHSALLLREVLTLIAKGELHKEDVALHWMERSEEGDTTVRTADLDDDGAYGEDWPQDFDRTELEADEAYLDAVETRRTGE